MEYNVLSCIKCGKKHIFPCEECSNCKSKEFEAVLPFNIIYVDEVKEFLDNLLNFSELSRRLVRSGHRTVLRKNVSSKYSVIVDDLYIKCAEWYMEHLHANKNLKKNEKTEVFPKNTAN